MFKIFKKTMKISELMECYTLGKLDMSPYYQRSGKVWTNSKRQDLIDSIFNEIDLPKFYFHFYPEGVERKYDYAVIDGKQRIMAIMAFLNDELRLKREFTFLDSIDGVNIGGSLFSQIQESYPYIAAKFLLFEIDIVFVDSDDIERINEMFIRINAGIPVNNAEKRNAVGGRLMEFIVKECSNHPFFNGTVCFSDKRNTYQEIFLKLFVLEYKGEIVTLSNKSIEKILKECKKCERNELKFIDAVNEGLDKMYRILGEKCIFLKTNNIVTYYLFLKGKPVNDIRVRQFIERFENERNRVDDKNNENVFYYLQYNELVKQGTYQKKSIERRIDILEELYKNFFEIEDKNDTQLL
ncbi:DUF262 domain-containing protein [Lachnospiraceae bacterium 62-35]